MTGARLGLIIVIFAGATVAWMILGGSVRVRTEEAGSRLRDEVAALWGEQLTQTSPTLSITGEFTEKEREDKKEPFQPVTLAPDSTDIQADVDLDLRRKGLLWYRTYKVTFDASYTVANPLERDGKLTTKLFLPTRQANYDDFHFSVNGLEAAPSADEPPEARSTVKLTPGEEATIKVHYEARGMDTWRYSFGSGSLGVKNFKMVVRTDFDRIDFPPRSLSPDTKGELDGGWELTWESKHLISGLPMGVEMPEKLNPGPWAARLSFFAPVGLLFYIFVLVIVGVVRDENLHPMLVLFSWAFYFPGYTGLSITVASIVTLALIMHLTAKVDWEQKFKSVVPPPKPPPPTGTPGSA